MTKGAKRTFLSLACLFGVSALAEVAFAAEPVVITSATDSKFFNVHVTVDYMFESKTAGIVRETAVGSMPRMPVRRIADLEYTSTRHTLTPRLSVGFFHDIEVHAALPIIWDSRKLSFDETDAATSPTVSDGFLPATGYDATQNGGPAGAGEAFVGPSRQGLDQIWLGLRWAPLNQRRDPSKPTWTIGAEYRLAVGDAMKFDRADPGGNKGVGRGVNEIFLDTSLARRIGWADPFVNFWWLYPTRAGDHTYPDFDLSVGQEDRLPQQRAGTRFGFEAVVWEQPEVRRRIGLEFATRIEATFQGRGYSELWEVLATNPQLMINPDPGNPMSTANVAHPGTTVIENYATFGGTAAVRGQMGSLVHFRIGGGFEYDQGHAITFDDAGEDRPNSTGDTDTVVTPGTAEENPLHFRIINLPGKRYRVDQSLTWQFFVMGRILF